MSETQVSVLPANFKLPAHLMTQDAAAAIAAANAAAGGGIKTGSFTRISIKGGKFHIVKGGETTTIMAPAQPGQPALPQMILETVIVGANPGLSKTFFPGEYQPGDDKEPTCSAADGITPDAHIAAPQHSNCAQCPQNQWGSKISKVSGKEVKACADAKVLALLPADLSGEAMAFNVTPSALGDWGKYVQTLSGRGIPVNAIVTNITFDATASHPKNKFSFNRMLTEAEYAHARLRAMDTDVTTIVAPPRRVALAAPVAAPVTVAPVAPATPPVPAYIPPVPPPAPQQPSVGFGAPAPVVAAPAAPAAPAPVVEVEKPKRAAHKAAPVAVAGDLSHLPPEILATVNLLGVANPASQALLAQYPRPAAPETSPAEGDKPQPSGVVTGPAAAAPVVGGFGVGAASPGAVVSPGASLKDQLAARLLKGQQTAAAAQ